MGRVPLRLEPIELASHEEKFSRRIDEFVVERRLICPCHVVSYFLVSQEFAYRCLVGLVDRGAVVCVRIEDLLGSPDLKPIEYLDPLNAPSDALAFVEADFYRQADRADLRESDAIREFLELSDVAARRIPNYRIGPHLKELDGSAMFRVELAAAFRFLSILGVVGRRMVCSRFPHSSVIMLVRRALGVVRYLDLANYIPLPAAFFLTAIENSETFDNRALAKAIAPMFIRIEEWSRSFLAHSPQESERDFVSISHHPYELRRRDLQAMLAAVKGQVDPIITSVHASSAALSNQSSDWTDEFGDILPLDALEDMLLSSRQLRSQ